ncbi:MAG: deoxyribose-phosphate aldolase [candidate division KSB1 bacterium]|jgi:deoxyribose-phosphate aldolase|nr:deoxyribose-phosphate aldolase [candidate division KSB1 bacterium]
MDLAKFIDHTLLKSDAISADIERLCREAAEYGFASVCIHPVHVPFAYSYLKGTDIHVCTVAGFPLGANMPEIKALEAEKAIEQGAREIDMVMNVGALKSGDHALVLSDITGVVRVCSAQSARCKVIIETCLLNDDEKVKACRIVVEAGAHFVKTSTGFGGGGALEKDVRLMKQAVAGSKVEVKAAGGIRTYADAKKMVDAGASRLGTSSGVQIIKEMKAQDT